MLAQATATRLLILPLVLLSGVATGATSAPRLPARSKAPRVEVPPDSTEVRWRSAVRAGAVASQPPLAALGGTTPRPSRHRLAVRRRAVAAAVSASAARLVRLTVWPTSSPPPVELVVEADVNPALYLRRRLLPLLNAIGGGDAYLEVVDRRGVRILEWAALPGEWTIIVPRALRACSPLQGDALVSSRPPCPAG